MNELTNIQSRNKFLISFDVESLFTNIPLSETIDLAVETIFKHNPEFPISKANLGELFTFATSQTDFLSNGLFYDQRNGVGLGSPLVPILSNLLMGYHQGQWIGNYKDSQLLYYWRYVDDTFCLFHNEQDAMKYLSYLNSRHPNIRFTFETQLNGKLPFLDVLVDNSGAFCIASIYHKSTYTGLVTNFLSFTCFKYKVGLIYTLVDRIFKINNTTGREKGLHQLWITLQCNSFPNHLIDKITKGYKNKFSSRPTENNTSTTGIQYFNLPFVGDLSAVTRKKLKHLLDVFCKDIDIRIVFSFKIKNFFSFKDYSRCIKISGCVSIYLCEM